MARPQRALKYICPIGGFYTQEHQNTIKTLTVVPITAKKYYADYYTLNPEP